MMSSSGLRMVSSVGSSAGKTVEVGDGNGALAVGAEDFDLRIERVEGDAHVGGIGGDAGVRSACAVVGLAEDGVDSD